MGENNGKKDDKNDGKTEDHDDGQKDDEDKTTDESKTDDKEPAIDKSGDGNDGLSMREWFDQKVKEKKEGMIEYALRAAAERSTWEILAEALLEEEEECEEEEEEEASTSRSMPGEQQD